MQNDNRASVIAGILRDRIAGMRVGQKLPPVRELSKEFGASPATISQAIASLSALGSVRAEPGRGTFVAGRDRLPEPDYSWQSATLGRARVDARRAARLGAYAGADDIQLSWGYLAPELQPLDELRTLGARAARSPRAWSMAPATGLADLRRVFASEFHADPADVLIVPGGQQALVFAMRTLTEPGTTVITESPSYPGAIIAAQAAGLDLAAVPADADGVRPDRLADALERTRATLIYLQPCYANPTGAVLESGRREEVLRLAARYGAFVIEDDWARHLSIDGTPPSPLFTQDPDGHVVSIATLTKPVAPGLRVGAIIARGPAGERLRTARIADDMCVPPLTQEIALNLLTSNAWPRHLKRLRNHLAERRDTMIAEAHASLPGVRVAHTPHGGIHFWARLPEGTDTTALTAAALRAGVLIGDGSHFYVDEPPAPCIRLSFSAASTPQIAEGIRRLAPLLVL
ncbi:PLP-dependent aminotransferase family protein [Streptomyces sp. NPDC001834]|uniref:aminotransferase-like domain-containing protein n=1 Tax=Streptomyces sp. NPDC001834 TaxID=3364616 RepID=UPI0036B04579